MKTILTIFKNTKVSKAAALDNLSGCFLKDDAKVLDKPITDLCNLSITSGKFPGSCKYVKLIPIYKKGSLTEASNYRTRSLLPLISKVIEKVIHDQIAHFSTLEIYHTFLNLVFAKSFHWLMPLLFKWPNSEGFRPGFDNWNGFDWFTKSLWYDRPWYSTTKIACYWFLWTFSKLVLILSHMHVCPVVYRKDLFWPSTFSDIY